MPTFPLASGREGINMGKCPVNTSTSHPSASKAYLSDEEEMQKDSTVTLA